MRNRSKRPKRIAAAALTALFLSHQTLMLSAVATEITGVTGNNGIYNINPSAVITKDGKLTNIGYRKYKDFNLDKGDIANLIFKYGINDIDTFINLVENRININGLVNTMRDNGFYNGKAVFVSPNGMVVGASGVLNVGSLSVYTPTKATFDNYVKNPQAEYSALARNNSGKPVTINGKVIAANDVEIYGGKVTVAKDAGIIAGVNEAKMAQITSNEMADTLFNQLVNTDNMNKANEFYSNNGNIYIKTNQTDEIAGVDIQGHVKNFGSGNTNIYNNGLDGVKIAGNVSNVDGLLKINNVNGGIDISGNIKNSGTTQILNVPADGY